MKRLALGLVFTGLLLPVPAQAITRGNFWNAVTRGVGAEVTLHTRRAGQSQIQAEGGFAANNPLNTTQIWGSSWPYNEVGVQNYRTGADGIAATVKTLSYPDHGYGRIIRALKLNLSAAQILRAVGNSDWGTSGGLALAVLDDIKHNRTPNTLAQLERTQVAG